MANWPGLAPESFTLEPGPCLCRHPLTHHSAMHAGGRACEREGCGCPRFLPLIASSPTSGQIFPWVMQIGGMGRPIGTQILNEKGQRIIVAHQRMVPSALGPIWWMQPARHGFRDLVKRMREFGSGA